MDGLDVQKSCSANYHISVLDGVAQYPFQKASIRHW